LLRDRSVLGAECLHARLRRVAPARRTRRRHPRTEQSTISAHVALRHGCLAVPQLAPRRSTCPRRQRDWLPYEGVAGRDAAPRTQALCVPAERPSATAAARIHRACATESTMARMRLAAERMASTPASSKATPMA